MTEREELDKLTEAIGDITGTDEGTAEWLAGRVLDTLGNMRADSLGEARPQPWEERLDADEDYDTGSLAKEDARNAWQHG